MKYKKAGKMIVVIIISWIVLCFVVGCVAENIGRNFGVYFVTALILSPIIGFIILALNGKATNDEILNANEHIFYCSTCNCTFSSAGEEEKRCLKCGRLLDETDILFETWKGYSADRKAKLKLEFSLGQHMRNGSATVQSIVPPTSSADELKKFKELFDMGAITQGEFEAKKKQLLGL